MTPAISEYRSSGIRELPGDLTEGDERNSEIGGIFPQLFARPRVLEAREEEVASCSTLEITSQAGGMPGWASCLP